MKAKRVGTIPVDVKRVGGIHPCENCGVKLGVYRVSMPHTKAGKTEFKMCERCTKQFQR